MIPTTSADHRVQIKLLRKLKKTVSFDKWERVLTRFTFSYSSEDGWELDRSVSSRNRSSSESVKYIRFSINKKSVTVAKVLIPGLGTSVPS